MHASQPANDDYYLQGHQPDESVKSTKLSLHRGPTTVTLRVTDANGKKRMIQLSYREYAALREVIWQTDFTKRAQHTVTVMLES